MDRPIRASHTDTARDRITHAATLVASSSATAAARCIAIAELLLKPSPSRARRRRTTSGGGPPRFDSGTCARAARPSGGIDRPAAVGRARTPSSIEPADDTRPGWGLDRRGRPISGHATARARGNASCMIQHRQGRTPNACTMQGSGVLVVFARMDAWAQGFRARQQRSNPARFEEASVGSERPADRGFSDPQ